MIKSLYTKYRPQTFNEVIGQAIPKKILINSILKENINHAYVFFGIQGTGKTSIARIFAKRINCESPFNENPCNRCVSCETITSSSSIDVIEIDAASNNGIDEIRSIKEKINYSMTNSKYKIYIIDEVHMLSKAAFNALLKILEEPPKNIIFILATTEINKIPETILSRTILINFEVISEKNILNGIETILKSENIIYDSRALDYLVNTSCGSMRDAISLLESVLLYSSEITETSIVESLGLIKYKEIYHLLTSDIKKLEEKISNSEIDSKKLIYILIEVLKNLIKEGEDEYRTLLYDVLNIAINIKDPHLIKISITSLLSLFINNSNNNVSHGTIENKKGDTPSIPSDKIENLEKSDYLKQDDNEIGISNKKETVLTNLNKEKPTEELIDLKPQKSVYKVITDFVTSKHYISILFNNDEIFLNKVKRRWTYIYSYFNNIEYKEYVNILLDTKVLATDKRTIIVGFNLEKNWKNFKKISLSTSFLSFIKEITDSELYVLPIMANEWGNLLELHNKLIIKERVINEPLSIPKEATEEDNKEINEMKNLFGEKFSNE